MKDETKLWLGTPNALPQSEWEMHAVGMQWKKSIWDQTIMGKKLTSECLPWSLLACTGGNRRARLLEVIQMFCSRLHWNIRFIISFFKIARFMDIKLTTNVQTVWNLTYMMLKILALHGLSRIYEVHKLLRVLHSPLLLGSLTSAGTMSPNASTKATDYTLEWSRKKSNFVCFRKPICGKKKVLLVRH